MQKEINKEDPFPSLCHFLCLSPFHSKSSYLAKQSSLFLLIKRLKRNILQICLVQRILIYILINTYKKTSCAFPLIWKQGEIVSWASLVDIFLISTCSFLELEPTTPLCFPFQHLSINSFKTFQLCLAQDHLKLNVHICIFLTLKYIASSR